MHLMESEWVILSYMLGQPEKLSEHLPLIPIEEIEARCEDIVESWEYNHNDRVERHIMMTCIEESDIHEWIQERGMPYQVALDMVDAAHSLQDRFATFFKVRPSKWMELVGKKVDEPLRLN